MTTGEKTTRPWLTSYRFRKGDSRPRAIRAYCYRCTGDHAWSADCPGENREKGTNE